MAFTEFPKVGEPRIANGTFVVFSFDPATYASFLDPEDALLSAAASQIKRKKYLGLVEKVGPLDLPRLRQNLDIRVVGLAPPQEGEDDVYPTNPKRCIPVHPCTSHPDARAALQASAPLPWSECYVHTLQLVNAFVSRVHHANPTKAVVRKDEMRRLAKCVVQDQYAAAEQARAVESDCDESESGDDPECGSDAESTYGSEAAVEPEMAAPPDVYMEIWEDLGIASALGEPKDVGADIDEIIEMGQAWAERKNRERGAKTTHTLEWAARVADLGNESSESVINLDLEGYMCAGCDDLTPEDAIDERRAQAASSDRGISNLVDGHERIKVGPRPFEGALESVDVGPGERGDREKHGLLGRLATWICSLLNL
ncbi:hypothetical protein AURDEDRAFT_129951 [Auricularia subglabra TFB-10046 SS5]|nr:hypothetical protein AURDEDRAFT_129951 [Auricularia subglabra TFB-10046 SS5]